MILSRAMIGRVKEGIWIVLYRNILHCMFLRVFISHGCSVFIGLGSCLFFWGMGVVREGLGGTMIFVNSQHQLSLEFTYFQLLVLNVESLSHT